MLMELIERHGLEKLGVAETHKAVSWQDLASDGLEAVKIEAMVVPNYVRGPHKGKPNYGNCDHSTRKTVYVLISEHKQWLKEYEAKTGNCAECDGSGKRMQSWNHINGMTWTDCPQCSGTGKSK